MKHYLAAALLLPLALAACAGGDRSASAPIPRARSERTARQAITHVLTEAESDALTVPQPLYTPGTNDLLYVGNTGNNSITVYHHNDSGNTAPVRIIMGPKTGLNNPGQLSEDGQGHLYVASRPASVLVFAHGANGNVAPIRTLAGPSTGLHNVEAMTIDQSTGKIFVVDDVPFQDLSAVSLLRFPPNANGNEAPFARSSVFDENRAIQIASDSTGKNVIETHGACCENDVHSGLMTLPKQFANGASLAAPYSIAPFEVGGVADDPTTKTYLTSSGYNGNDTGIYRLDENTIGNGQFMSEPPSFMPKLVSVIINPANCGSQIALGYLRNIYTTCGGTDVYVYAHDASGYVKPLRVLSGSKTGLNGPYGIYEGQ